MIKRRTLVNFSKFFKAEEITLTIGQAFDLAYRRFLENSGREVESRKQISQMKGKIDNLERQNETLRRRLLELSYLVENSKLAGFLNSEGVSIGFHPFNLR